MSVSSKPSPPKGLQVRRAKASIETVYSVDGEIRLKLTEPGAELIELSLREGDRLTLVPPTEANRNISLSGRFRQPSIEIYYVLEGSLRSDFLEPQHLGRGDIIVTRDLQDTTVFDVENDVKIICITTQPTFHEFSEIIRDLMRLAVEVEVKDKGSAEHCARVGRLALAMGRRLGLSDDRLLRLDYGAYLHDLGKVKVPLEILLKPTRLNEDEWKVIKQHPVYGRELIEGTAISDVGPIIEQHHERFDGSGYPHGLSGSDILTESYLVAVADSFDAMTSNRPYHDASSQQYAVAEIKKGSDRFYPREVVEAFLSCVEDASRS